MTSFALSDGTRSLELIGMPPGIYLAAEPFELPVAANEDTYATSPDMNGGRRVRSTPQNVEGRAAVHIDELTSADFWDSVDNFLDLVASAHRNKGTITWTPPEGVAVTFDLEAINPVSFPQNRLLRQRKGTVEFGFTARPYGRLAPRSVALTQSVEALSPADLPPPDAAAIPDLTALDGYNIDLDASELGLANGAAVTTWTDESGNGNDATQSDAAKKPTFQTNVLNGEPAVYIDGSSDDRLTLAGAAFGTEATYFLVFNPEAADAYGVLFASAPGPGFFYNSGTGKFNFYSAGDHYQDTVFGVGTPRIVSVVLDGTDTTFYIDGVEDGIFAGVSPALTFANIGDDASSNNFKGHVFRIIGFDSALSDEDREAIEAGLAARYYGGGDSALAVWFKATEGISVGDGDPIPEWEDQSGNDRHAEQATGANQPTYVADAWEGHPAVLEDATSGLLTPTGLGPFSEWTAFMVASGVNLNVGDTDYGGGYIWDAQVLGERQSMHLTAGQWRATNGSDVVISENPSNTPSILAFVCDGEQSWSRCDGLPGGAGDPGDNALTGFTIAGSYNLTGGVDAHLFELIYVPRVLTEAEVLGVEQYLREEYFSVPEAPVPDGEAVTIADTSGVHYGFPGLCETADGDLLAVYRVGVDHIGQDGILAQKRSTDNGETWGAQTTVLADVDDARDAALATLADGTIVLTYTRSNDNDTDQRPFCMRSTDNGETWGEQIPITHGYSGAGSWAFACAPVVELANGDLIVPLNGRDATANYYSRQSRSTDGGLTWASDGVIAATTTPSAGFWHQEPFIHLTESGELLCFLRSTDPAAPDRERIYLTRSTDDAATWSVPVYLFPGAARPACLETPDGDLVLMSRQWQLEDNQIAYVRRSTDGGVTWSDARLINPQSGGIFFTYGQWVYLGPTNVRRSLVAAMSFQSPDAKLYLYRFSEVPQFSTASFFGPIDSAEIRDVGGHVDAFAELTLTDVDGEPRDDVEIGVQPDHDPNNPWPLRLEAAALQALGGTLNVDVIEATTIPEWVAVGGTAEQPHHGPWRVKAWIETTAEDAQVRLSWKAGDGPPRELAPVLPHLTGEVVELDLGLINIAEGTWTGQVEVRATAGEDFDLHALEFVPGSGWARARAPAASFVPTSVVVADSFDQAGDPNLTGQTPQIGPAWAAVTGSDADDITVNSTQHRAERAAVSDASLHVGRMVSAGATNHASVQIQGEVDLQDNPVAASSLRQGYFCRLGDIDNWLAIVRINSAAAKTFKVEILKRDGGGTPVTLALSKTLGDIKDRYMLCLRVEVTGRWTAWAWPTSAEKPNAPLLWGTDADLATGGTLDDGRVGLFGANISASAVTMIWDDVAVFPGPGVNHAIWDDQSLYLDHEKAERENEAGTSRGDVPHFEGDRLLVPPATRNDLVSRLVVKQDRNDLVTLPVADAGDELQGELEVTERVLLTNGGA